MKIITSTNIDKYRGNIFSELHYVPRVGEYVSLKDGFINNFRSMGLPTKLEVVSVTYNEENVNVELHYNSTDLKAMIALNINPW